MGLVEGVELVNQAFGVNPAQRVIEDVELPGVVAQDHGHGEEAMRQDRAQQGAFGGDLRRIGVVLSSLRPSRRKCALQASGSAKLRSPSAASRAVRDAGMRCARI